MGRDWTLQYHILFGYMVWFLTLSTWVQNDPNAFSSFDVLFFLVYRHVYILCWTCLGILQFSYPFGRRLWCMRRMRCSDTGFFCFLHNFIHRNKLKIVENHCKVWSPGNQEFEVVFPLPTLSGHKGLQSFKRAAQGTRNSWNRRKLESYMIIHNHTISYYIILSADMTTDFREFDQICFYIL